MRDTVRYVIRLKNKNVCKQVDKSQEEIPYPLMTKLIFKYICNYWFLISVYLPF